jgi:hypothetical protein
MPPKDLEQARVLIEASEARIDCAIRARLDERFAATEARWDERLAATEARFSARLDRAVEAIATDISQTRQEFSDRLEAIERRLTNQAATLASVEQRTVALNRWADQFNAA